MDERYRQSVIVRWSRRRRELTRWSIFVLPATFGAAMLIRLDPTAWLIFVPLLIFYLVLITVYNRCPACECFMGKQRPSRFCPNCGVRLTEDR